MNRRHLLSIAPAALISCGAPATASCSMPLETPVAVLYREWVIAREAEAHAYEVCETEAEWDAASNARMLIENRMLATPSQSHADWMLKVCAYAAFGESGSPDAHERPDLWAEARALVGA